MTSDKIKILLEKYYEGLTSSEEERMLYDYFNACRELSEEEACEKRVFMQLYSSCVEIPKDLEKNLSTKIDEWAQSDSRTIEINPPKKYGRLIQMTSIAAAVAAILTFSWLQVKEHNIHSRDIYADTFDNPQEASEEAVRALMYISSHFNQGMQPVKESQEQIQKQRKIIQNQLSKL